MVGVCAGIGAGIAAVDVLVAWLTGAGRFAPRRDPGGAGREDPALAELLRMLEWPDERLAHFATDFAVRCSEFERDPRLVAGCVRIIRFGLARQGKDADRMVRAGMQGLDWLDASGHGRRFESSILERNDLKDTRNWLQDPATVRRRARSGGR